MLFCHITSQIPSDPYQDLLQEKGGGGFPYLVFMDEEGNVLAKHEGSRDAAGFEQTLGTAQAFIDLKKKAESGDKAAKKELVLKQIELGHIKPEDADAKLKELGDLTPEEQAKVNGVLANAQVTALFSSFKTQPTPEQLLDLGKKLAEMQKAGRVPTEPQIQMNFWALIMDYAESTKDVALFEEGLTTLKAMLSGNPQAKEFLEQKEKALEAMKAGGGK